LPDTAIGQITENRKQMSEDREQKKFVINDYLIMRGQLY
jgi:hypothetical protein